MSDFVLRGGTLVFPDKAPEKKDVLVKGGKIAALLAPGAAAPAGIAEQSAAGLHVFPGLIDCHVHFGLGEKITEYSHRDRRTPRRAASPPCSATSSTTRPTATSTGASRTTRVARAHVDFGFHFTTANELHIKELGEYVSDYGVTSFKYFMNFKGEEGRYLGLDGTDDGFLYALLRNRRASGGRPWSATPRTSRSSTATRRKIQAAGGSTLKDWSACQARDHRVRAGAARHVPGRGARRARLLSAHLLAQGARRDPPLAPALQGRHRRDLPALPHAHRGLRARRHGQGQPAVPHQGRPRSAVGGDLRRHRRPRRLRPQRAQEGRPRTSRSGSPRRASPAPRPCCR